MRSLPALDMQTPREIVLFEAVHRIEKTPELRDLLTTWIHFSLDDAGQSLHDARRRRSAILGTEYKTAPRGIEKL